MCVCVFVVRVCALRLQLVLRALNDSKSAFSAFRFHPEFFQLFRPPPSGSSKCKFSIRACQNVFRSMRSVEQVKLFFSAATDHTQFIVFQQACKHGKQRERGYGHRQPPKPCSLTHSYHAARSHSCVALWCLSPVTRTGITKTHSFIFEECEIYQAAFDEKMAPSRLVVRPSTLLRFISHIHGTEEITLAVSSTHVEMRSYHQNLDEQLSAWRVPRVGVCRRVSACVGVCRRAFHLTF